MTDYTGPDRREPEQERWHIKREFQLSHIITTVVMGVSVILYLGKMEQRIALIEQSVQSQHERDARQDQAIGEGLKAIDSRLGKLDDKLDRALERRR